ncbi:MAG: hypothetical protein ACRDKS_09895 [Actinomycetota bacterium]
MGERIRRGLAWLLGRPDPDVRLLPTGTAASAPEKGFHAQPEERRPIKRDGDVWGISCSGGGIRSAAYNLGALQVLREYGVLEQADYMTSVSGGGYIAAAHYIVTASSADKSSFQTLPAYAKGSPEERHFRNHSTYLAPDFKGGLLAVFNLLYGFGLNALVLGAWVLVAAKTVAVLYHYWLFDPPQTTCFQQGIAGGCTLHFGPGIIWTAAALGGAGVGLVAIERVWDHYIYPGAAPLLFIRAWAARLFMLGAAFAALFLALPWLLVQINQGTIGRGALGFLDNVLGSANDAKWWAPLAAGAGTAIASAWRLIGTRGRGKIALAVASLVGPALVLAPFVAWTNDSALTGIKWSFQLVAFAATGIYVGLVGDNMRWSLHPFYRERLATAFALRRTSVDQVEELAYADPIPMSTMTKDATPGLPQLVVCAAANVSDVGVTPPGRHALSFVFSHDRSGMPAVAGGTVDTARLEAQAGRRNLTLPAMVAISGAAVSPSMGRMTIRPLRFLLGLMNVRLGVWVPNPAKQDGWTPPGWKAWFGVGRVGVLHLVYEMLGINGFRRKFLYVTDGGHVENLGLVELLRRGCSVIFCFDASGDRVDEFNTIGEAVAMARSDLGVEIDIDPDRLRPKEGTPWSLDDWVIANFRYKDGSPGYLVFAKAAVVESAPWDVRAYRLEDRRFPTHSTGDQFFDDRQFEAYPALGRFTARRAVQGLAQVLEAEALATDATDSTPAPSSPMPTS